MRASAAELDGLEVYQQYQDTETALRKLSKTVTVSILNVEKTADGFICDGTYYLPKTKVVIPGDNSGAKTNDVQAVISGLTTAGVIEGTSGSSLKINGTTITGSGDYSWHCMVNGVHRGTYSYLSSRLSELQPKMTFVTLRKTNLRRRRHTEFASRKLQTTNLK